MKINIYKSIYNFQETNTNFLENLESLNDDNYELLNDKKLVSDSNELKLINFFKLHFFFFLIIQFFFLTDRNLSNLAQGCFSITEFTE